MESQMYSRLHRLAAVLLVATSIFLKPSVAFTHHPTKILSKEQYPAFLSRPVATKLNVASKRNKDPNDDWIPVENAEVIQGDTDEDDEEDDWVPDREKARRKREKVQQVQAYQADEFAAKASRPQSARAVATDATTTTPSGANNIDSSKASAYTEEEEEVIRSMGGKTKQSASKREPGFLGDSTLEEIATDYSVPVCYLADVLCIWGVPVPINVHDRLGDLVTGEQAFAILEAVNSLDVAALHDRYSNQSLINLCGDMDIDLGEAFGMAAKEGWSLPFGVHTVLRVEQEDELLRVLGGIGS